MINTGIDQQRNMDSLLYLAKRTVPKDSLVHKENVTNMSQDNTFSNADLKTE